MTPPAPTDLSVALLEKLHAVVPADHLVVDPDVLAGLSHDDAEWRRWAGRWPPCAPARAPKWLRP